MKRCILAIVFFTGALGSSLGQGLDGLRPDFLQLQYAGSIGYVSAGAGYNIAKNHALLSFHFGHVPEGVGGPLNIFSTRFLYIPKVYGVSERVTIAPYNFGMMISYHLGSDFRSRWPSHRYPENYYWWQTSFRFHLNIQPSVTLQLYEHTVFKSITAYFDLNANELYLVSFAQNAGTLRLWDVLKGGAGIRFNY